MYACAVVLILGVVGCTGQSDTTSNALTATDVFGDLSDVDFCSILDRQKLAKMGKVDTEPSAELGRCTMHLDVDGQAVSVSVGVMGEYFVAKNPGTPVDGVATPDGVTMRKIGEVSGVCNYSLDFSDGVRIMVMSVTTNDDGVGDAPQCSPARVATEGALGLIMGGTVDRLSYPENSFADAESCASEQAVLRVERVSALVGQPLRAHPDPGLHSCSYRPASGADEPFVTLRFEWQSDLAFVMGTNEREVTVAGRRSRIGSAAPSGCRVRTTRPQSRESPVWRPESENDVETASISVVGVSDECSAARTLAEHVWPTLPGS